MLTRQQLVRRYVNYDCTKKSRPVPDLDGWDWSSPDALDERLRSNGLKYGIITGYRAWELQRFGRDDLGACAIVSGIREFADKPRVLSLLRPHDEFEAWKPDRVTSWFATLDSGGAIDDDSALLIRPATRGERPARWYIEDGSGRAICFYRRLMRTPDSLDRAAVLLAREPDPSSTFMRERFAELLDRNDRR